MHLPRDCEKSTEDDWRRIAELLNEAGARLAPSGGVVGYHNYDAELRALADGIPALETLIRSTDPHIVFELDIGWAAAAGIDPAALLRRHRQRITLVHLKDVARNSVRGTTPKMVRAEPGRGLIDWSALRREIVGSEVRHAFVEQESPFEGARIDAARRAYAFFDRKRWTRV